jgi:uncharacterized membrane protein
MNTSPQTCNTKNCLRQTTTAWLVTALCFLPIDFAWLALTSSPIYQPALGTLLADKPDLAAAAAFYAIYVLGLTQFTVRAWEPVASWPRFALRAALFGLVAYATYDLTNQATLRNWPAWLTAIDLAWGAVVTAVSSVLGRVILGKLKWAVNA